MNQVIHSSQTTRVRKTTSCDTERLKQRVSVVIHVK